MTQGSTHGIPIDTDGTLSADSDQLVASQKATKTYVDTTAATKQPVDATLSALAAANWAADALPIGTGADTLAQTAFAANTFPARSSAGSLVAKTITDFGLSLVDDANAQAGRATLAIVYPYEVLMRAQSTFTGAAGAGTKYMADANANNSASGTLAVASGRGIPLLDLVAADYAITGLTTTLLLRGQVTTNNSAPAVTITVGLYPVTIVAGVYTLGTVIAGSTVAIASPAANSIVTGSSGSFSLPADGAYMIGAITSGTPSGSLVFAGQLEIHQT